MDFVKTFSRNCEKHGVYEAKRWTMPTGGAIESPCPACRDVVIAADAATKARAQELQFKLALSSAGVGSRYYDASFDNYRTARAEEADALAIMRGYAETFSCRTSPNIVMYGETGTGKTHLSCALTSNLIKRGFSVTYLPILTLFSRYQDITSYGGNGSREDFFARLRAPDLLIVDEIGITAMRETEKITLHRVIDERYNRNAPIAIVGNRDLPDLTVDIGERAMRRVMEGAKIIAFTAATQGTGDLFDQGGRGEDLHVAS